jgi:CubicO group peptidase (beta-lactamase class C family)
VRRRLVRIVAAVLAAIALLLVVWIGVAAIIYPPEYVRRVLLWRDSDVGDYLHNFPHRPLHAATEPFRFESAPEEDRVTAALESAFAVDDIDALLTGTETQAFIVIQDDRVVFERYYNGWQRESMLTSFSVAKSFVSTLVLMAIEEGYVGSIDDPITNYLPEMSERDERFERVTIRHLLTMSSGFEYQEMRWFVFNGDDPLTTYHPDQREISLNNTRITGAPGQAFHYNKYHPQLLGMILERATGMSVTEWTQTRLWDRLGMEFDGAWTLDSTDSGFEKMEAGLNARAIDFAKLGRLFLDEGRWDGEQLLSAEWVARASGSDPAWRAPAFAEDRFYGLMWWGAPRASGPPDFYAAGDHGQYIYVSPANRTIIVRMGVEYGIGSRAWTDGFSHAAQSLD